MMASKLASDDERIGLDDELNGLLEIRDPEVDGGRITVQIRERMLNRRRNHPHEAPLFPTFAAASYPGVPQDGNYDRALYHYLRLANESFAHRETGPAVEPSPATRIPVLGRLWEMIRSQAHALVLFYVNRSVAQQVTVDRYIVSTLNRLTAQVHDLQREVEALRQERTAWALGVSNDEPARPVCRGSQDQGLEHE